MLLKYKRTSHDILDVQFSVNQSKRLNTSVNEQRNEDDVRNTYVKRYVADQITCHPVLETR